MPKPTVRVPALVHHKPSDRARVRIAGRDIWLGKWGSLEADERYRRIVAEYLTGIEPAPSRRPGRPDPGTSINELVIAYWSFAEGYYRKDGQPTSELPLVRDVLKFVRQHYGSTPAAEFGPLKLKALRESLIARGICRKSINQRVGRIKRLFKWGVENELVPPTVHHGLTAVAGLRKGRTEASESVPVAPVSDDDVNAVLPFLNRQLGAMVKLQAFTGARPGEVCSMRPCDIDRDADVWEYRPSSHKTQHHGHERVVYIGPRGQRVLAEWIDNRPADSFCFSPSEARAERSKMQRVTRKSPVQPSQQNRRTKRPKKQPGQRYTTMSYGHAIAKACEKAGIESWSPNRLRHTAATAIRKGYGIEAAQVSLGHSVADVTQVYAERDAELARKVALEIG